VTTPPDLAPPPAARTPDAAAPSVAPEPTGPEASTLAWVGPFAVFMLLLAVTGELPLPVLQREIVRLLVLVTTIAVLSRRILPRAAPHWPASIALGVAVFVMWVAPDALVPGWRDHWLFQNGVTGRLKTSIAPAELTPAVLALRTARAALVVPIVEELFWRGWLPRWLQDTRFARVPLGTYTPFAFWGTAVLFAAEHGPYWEVGLLCGIIYNWWMRRTRSLGDLILVHAVTNACLSAYVIATGRWSFWM
jgi:CAAX prenyl protease-like protein